MAETPKYNDNKRALRAAPAPGFFYVTYNDPNVIVEVIRNKQNPLYDPRVERPVNPEMVASMKLRGQENPAEGQKMAGERDGKQVVVLTKGRGRWAAMQQAWVELAAAGTPPERMPPFKLVIRKYVTDADAMEASIIEDEHRIQDEPIAKARKLQTYLNLMGDTAEMRERARVIFNVSSVAIFDGLLKLLELNSDIQDKVSAGQIKQTAAAELVELNPDQQREAMRIVKEAAKRGAAPTAVVVRAAAREVTGKAPETKLLGRRQINDRVQALSEQLAKAKSEMGKSTGTMLLEARIHELRVVLGEVKDDDRSDEQLQAVG